MWQITGLVAVALIFLLGGLVQVQATPTATVDCGVDGNNIGINITDVDDLDEWSESDWRVNDHADCEPTFAGTTVTYPTIDPDNCSVTLTSEADFFMYVLTVKPTKTGSTPTRAHDYDFEITCKYNRDGIVKASFVPVHEVEDSETGSGQLECDLNLYKDAAHTTPVGSDEIPLGDVIYAEADVTDEFTADLDLAMDACYATTDQAGTSGRYDLIKDSCEDQDDDTVDYNCTSQTSATEGFSFEAFRYPDQSAAAEVWITCELHFCLTSDASSRCRTQCNEACSKRKRRDADQPTDVTYKVTTGPFRFVDGEKGQKDADTGKQEDQPASTANLAIILSVSGVVAIAIVCVVVAVVLRKRRQNVTVVTVAGGQAHDNNVKIA